MILTDEVITERMESPLNLLNRLKEITTPKTNVPRSNGTADIPSLPPKSGDLIPDLDEKLAYGGIKSKAVGIMTAAMNELQIKIHDIQKPKELAQITEQMAKVIKAVTPENRDDTVKAPQIIIYSPQVRQLNEYKTIDISSAE